MEVSLEAPPQEVVTDDIFLGGKLRLLQPARGHRAGHDAMLLAASAPSDARRAVDLGAGVGAAGLALAVRIENAEVILVEIDPAAAALAARNAARQQPDLSARITVVTADVATLGRPSGPALPAARTADLVLMNPPFNDPARHRTSPHAGRRRWPTAWRMPTSTSGCGPPSGCWSPAGGSP